MKKDTPKLLFPRIGIMGRYRRILPQDTVQAIVTFLTKLGCKVLLESDTASLLGLEKIHHLPREELAKHIDLMVVVGGDGSLLGAAKTIIANDIPIVGVNRGTLGFLTDIHPDYFQDDLLAVITGKYQQEQRMMIEAKLYDADKLHYATLTALNDIVLSPGLNPHLVEFSTYVDNHFVCEQRADGLIITTPTGSTAYALSAGGSIMHPELDALALVPMFPHKLSSRPIVVSGQSEIILMISNANDSDPTVNADGQERLTIPRGGHIQIKRLKHTLRLLHPLSYDYFETLRSKLGWEKR